MDAAGRVGLLGQVVVVVLQRGRAPAGSVDLRQVPEGVDGQVGPLAVRRNDARGPACAVAFDGGDAAVAVGDGGDPALAVVAELVDDGGR